MSSANLELAMSLATETLEYSLACSSELQQEQSRREGQARRDWGGWGDNQLERRRKDRGSFSEVSASRGEKEALNNPILLWPTATNSG